MEIAIIVGIILIINLLLGIRFARRIMYPNSIKYDEAMTKEMIRCDKIQSFYDSMDKEEVWIDSPYGYKLHGFWCDNNSKKTIVVVHGYTRSCIGSMRYAQIFYKMGYNVMVYDHRNHGLSGGKRTTMGHFEKFDLRAVVDWLQTTKGINEVGTHGESMGAATVLLHAAIDTRVKFIIEDCGYMCASDEFKMQLKRATKLPAFPVFYTASFINLLVNNTFFKDISPMKAIRKLDIPIMFIHGDADKYVPTEHALAMYHAYKGPKKMYLAKGSKHAVAWNDNPELYEAHISDFLQEFDN